MGERHTEANLVVRETRGMKHSKCKFCSKRLMLPSWKTCDECLKENNLKLNNKKYAKK